MAISAGTRFGPYQIVDAIGAGGMGEVYRAIDTNLKRDVALKVLPPSFVTDADRLARFQREAEVLASLNHANIAQVYGLERSEGTTALVMELVNGPTLADRIAQRALSPNEALDVASQVTAALEAAHDQGIVHRDLKPANVKLKLDGSVKVLDFGIAKVLETWAARGEEAAALTAPALTAAGLVLGTAAYMSPEQARGKAADKRADIWAFGCVLYEILTGRPAFGAEDVTATLARVLERDPDMGKLPAALSPAVRRTIELCLQKDPKKRIADIRDVRLALNGAFIAGIDASNADATAPSFLARNSRLAASVAALSLLLAGAVSLFHFRESPSLQPTLRYTIPFPKEGESEGLYFNLHLSPDGKFVAADGVIEQTAGIFVRSLDSLEWRRLTGTTTGDFAWSPDSRSIAYFAGATVTRVNVSGGPTQPIARVEDIFLRSTASWGRDVILVAPDEGGKLFAVAPDGSGLRTLATLEPGIAFRYPAFLPNGRDFLYTRIGASGSGIYVASLDEPLGRLLLPDESSAVFAPSAAVSGDGHLIFARDGRLMAQPFDAEALSLSGESFLVAERALWNNSGAAAVSAGANGIVAYFGGRNRDVDSRFVWRDRAGAIRTALGPAGRPAAVALSPDEKHAAFVRRGNVWLRDLERGIENPVTSDGTTPSNTNVVWSPSGDRVAYIGASAGLQELRVADPRDAGTAKTVYQSESFVSPTDWADGYLLYTQFDSVTNADVWSLPMDGDLAGTPVPVRRDQFFTSFGDVSPDGRWLAYVSDEAGSFDIWVQGFPSGSGKWRVSDTQSLPMVGSTQQPRWSRDGRELYFAAGGTGRATIIAAPVVMPLRQGAAPIGEPKPLFEVRVNSYAPWQGVIFYDGSSDGQRFLINEVDESTEPVITIIVNGLRLGG